MASRKPPKSEMIWQTVARDSEKRVLPRQEAAPEAEVKERFTMRIEPNFRATLEQEFKRRRLTLSAGIRMVLQEWLNQQANERHSRIQ